MLHTLEVILFWSMYFFAGANIGQLANLIDTERDEYSIDNRWWLTPFWLPVAIAALVEHWRSKSTHNDLEALRRERNELWQKIQRHWETSDDLSYPWESSVGAATDPSSSLQTGVPTWSNVHRSKSSSELLTEMPPPLSQEAYFAFMSASSAEPVGLEPVASILDRNQSIFPEPFLLIKPPTLDPVEPAGDRLASDPDFGSDFI